MGQASPCTHRHAYEIMTADNARGSGVWFDIMLSPFANYQQPLGSIQCQDPAPSRFRLSLICTTRKKQTALSFQEGTGRRALTWRRCLCLVDGAPNPRGPPSVYCGKMYTVYADHGRRFSLTALESRIQRGGGSGIAPNISSLAHPLLKPCDKASLRPRSPEIARGADRGGGRPSRILRFRHKI